MPKTILCVDDSVTMQKVAEITFHATEYQYVGAKNADEGLAAARKERPALILADAVMPGRTGYDLCAALKADGDLKDVPVLLMCGNSQAYDPARGSQVGADGHVIKPWDTQVMLDKVAEVLGSGAVAASPATGATASAPAPRAPAPAPAPAPRPAAASGPDRSGSRPASPAGMNKAPGAQPPSLPFSPPPARPASPASLSQPEPPRSATIMGMPSLKLPPTAPQGPQFSAPTPVSRPEPEPARPPAISRSAPPAPEPRGAARSAPPIPPPKLGPPPRSVAPSPSPAPVSAGPPATAAPTPAAPSHPAIPTMPRPPMIKGTPTRRPNLSAIQGGASGPSPSPSPARSSRPDVYDEPTRPRSAAALEAALSRANSATADAAGDAARSAGLDPNGPEMAALLELSRDVIERVVWEVVPDLAEAIIRENLDKLTAKAR